MQPFAHPTPPSLAQLAAADLARRSQVLVLRGDHVVAEECLGEGVSSETRFLLWSLSKPLTAAAVLVLIDRGDLDLDTPVSSVLPAFGAGGKALVTVKDVLLHRGGFLDVLPGEPPTVLVSMNDFADWHGAVSKICALPLRAEWFGRSTYHAVAYGILGAVIEEVAGQTYASFTQETIFDPLGMSHTSWGLPPEVCDVAAPALDPASVVAMRTGLAPAGNAWSTTRDMARFFQMLRAEGMSGSHRVLSPTAVRGMTMGQSVQDGTSTTFGYGTMVDAPTGAVFARGSRGTRTAYGHSGATAVQAWHDRQADLTLIALTDSLCTQEQSDARFDVLSDAVHERFSA